MGRKKDAKGFVDDKRVIADMNIEGMPHSIFRGSRANKLNEPVEKSQDPKLTKDEQKSLFLGVLSSYILFGVAIFGSFALFILFCIKVWFK
ncbi:MAG: hypothetical protein GX974_05660 [Clostridiales bacterium]|nr:hypothetical protein [Clostridiales bacterium]